MFSEKWNAGLICGQNIWPLFGINQYQFNDIVTVKKPSIDSVFFSVFGPEDIKLNNVFSYYYKSHLWTECDAFVYLNQIFLDLSLCDKNVFTVTAANSLCSEQDLHH